MSMKDDLMEAIAALTICGSGASINNLQVLREIVTRAENARLVAMELFDALREAEAEIERADNDYAFPRDYHLYYRIRDALAKASP